MTEGSDFIAISAGEGYQYLAWAHVISVTVVPVVHGEGRRGGGHLVARIVTTDGQSIEAHDDDARRIDATLRARAGIPATAAD